MKVNTFRQSAELRQQLHNWFSNQILSENNGHTRFTISLSQT